MIQYSCDRCKRMIDPDQEVRYEVRLEIQAVVDPHESHEPEDDRDHLMELDDLLENVDFDDYVDESAQRARYDLCPHCYHKFSKDPLGMMTPMQVGFSHN